MDGQHITNPEEYSQILDKIKKQNQLIQVSIPGVPEVFFSTILNIDHDRGILLLDELNSKKGHELLLVHKNLNAETKINGIGVQFFLDMLDSKIDNGIAIYKFKFPEKVIYLQKRKNFRINIGLGTDIPVKLKRTDGSPVYGKIINLSESGAGIELDKPYTLQMAEIIPFCEIRLPEEEAIQCQLEIRFTNGQASDSLQLIGAKFMGIQGKDQRTIIRLVLQLQRDLMRRLPKDKE